MKKQMKVIGFAALSSLLVVGGAMAAGSSQSQLIGHSDAICKLIAEFKGIFSLLRTLAFVGAGFIIAGWGWQFISETKEIDVKGDIKKKGLSMLVGFALLFGIGVILQLLSSPSIVTENLGCANELFGAW